jgi:hypothetical protein
MMNPPMPTLSPVWTSIRVERLRGCAPGVGVAVGVTVGVTVGVAVGEAVGVAEGVTVGLAVGVEVAVAVGDGVPLQLCGPRIATVTGVPVLKKPTVAFVATGGWSESNRKLYKVPQRMAFAFWFWANVSVLQLTASEV